MNNHVKITVDVDQIDKLHKIAEHYGISVAGLLNHWIDTEWMRLGLGNGRTTKERPAIIEDAAGAPIAVFSAAGGQW